MSLWAHEPRIAELHSVLRLPDAHERELRLEAMRATDDASLLDALERQLARDSESPEPSSVPLLLARFRPDLTVAKLAPYLAGRPRAITLSVLEPLGLHGGLEVLPAMSGVGRLRGALGDYLAEGLSSAIAAIHVLDSLRTHPWDLAGVLRRHGQPSSINWSDLRDLDLAGVDLSALYIEAARLERVSLRDASLRGTHLFRSELCRADLRGADLTDADIVGACLRGADLRGAVGLTEAQLNSASIDPATRLP